MQAMDGLLKKSYTIQEFESYVETEVKAKMGRWIPYGVVLHNTGTMSWPGHDGNGHPITPAQRIENMSVDWVARHFTGGPHLLISPDGLINTVWPLWLEGTHSPSWNRTHWGIEMVGDFNLEPFPEAMRQAAAGAIRTLYKLLGKQIDSGSFHLHKEDPKTTHKQCPGRNVGEKSWWVDACSATAPIPEIVAFAKPIDEHVHLTPAPMGANEFIRSREGKMLSAYPDCGGYSVGFGTHIYPDGKPVNKGDTCTQAQAEAWQSARTLSDWNHIQTAYGRKMPDGLAIAMLSFTYEFSFHTLIDSTWWKKALLNDYEGAAKSLLQWDKTKGPDGKLIENQGILKRRKLEAALFAPSVLGLSDTPPKNSPITANAEAAPEAPIAQKAITPAQAAETASAKPSATPITPKTPIVQANSGPNGTTEKKMNNSRTVGVSLLALGAMGGTAGMGGIDALLKYGPIIAAVATPFIGIFLRSAIQTQYGKMGADIAQQIAQQFETGSNAQAAAIAKAIDDQITAAEANGGSK